MEERNLLYPIFLKLEKLELLIIGGGEAGSEKMRFILKNSPNANIHLVATEISDEIHELSKVHEFIMHLRPFDDLDLEQKDLVIVATDDNEINHNIWRKCKQRKLLVNVADTPALCDFYLGSIISRGQVKVAISTNGKSPTFAKRIRQFLEEMIPEESNQLVNNLAKIRDSLKGDFSEKVKELNKITEKLVKK